MQESHIDYRFFFEVPSTRRCSTQRHIQGKHPNRCDDDHGSGDDDGDDDDGGDGDGGDDDDDDDGDGDDEMVTAPQIISWTHMPSPS